MSRAICDGCRYAPPHRLHACESPPSGPGNCSEDQCDWLVDTPLTLGVIWGGGGHATRGWGNSFGWLRNLHEIAAFLGRRLLVHPVNAYLPSSDQMRLGGVQPWLLPSVAEYVSRPGAFVVHDAAAAAVVVPGMPRGFGGLEKIENRTEYRWALVRHLDGLRTHTHLWLNLSRAAMYILTKSAPCTRWSDRTGSYEHAHIKHARNFLACVGRLFTTPVGPLADRYRMLRERAGTIGIAGESSTSSSRSSGSSDGGDGSSGGNGGGPARYVGVHIRTFGADMGIPRGVKPDAQLALSFYSWEVMVSAEADRVCVHRNAPLS